MARQLGTGKATGKVAGAQTSARLMGGVASMSTAGALAGKAITPPSLRVSARNVDTYYSPGKINAPAPAMMFAPPQIPDTSQDLVRLSKSLGMLSRPLEQMGQAAVQAEIQREEEIKASAQATQRLIHQQYPGQDFVTARDEIEKKAKAGDRQAQDLLTHMQAQSPLHLGYASRYMNMANLRADLDAAKGKWEQIEMIDGFQINPETNLPVQIPRESLEPGDPRIRQAMTNLLRIPDDPVVISQFEQLIYGKYSELTKSQATLHADYKKRTFLRSFNKVQELALASPNLSAEQAAATISALLTDGRQVLGVEGYKEVIKQIGPELAAIATQLSSKQLLSNGETIGLDEPVPEGLTVVKVDVDPKEQLRYLNRVLSVYDLIQAGPNGELLKDRLGEDGGVAGRIEIYKTILKEGNTLRSSIGTLEKDQGRKLAETNASIAGLDDPAIYLNPDKFAAAMKQATTLINNDPEYKNNPAIQKAALTHLTDYTQAKQRAFSTPVQNGFMNEAARIVDDPMLNATQKRLRIDSLVARGLTNKNARQYYKAIGEMHRTERDGHDKVMLNRIDKEGGLRDQLKAILKKKNVGDKDANWLTEYYEFFEGADGLTARRARNKRIMLSKPMPEGYDGSDEQWALERELLWRKSDVAIVEDAEARIKSMGKEALGSGESEIPSLAEMGGIRTFDKRNWRTSIGRKNILTTDDFKAEVNSLVSSRTLSNNMIRLLKAVNYTGKKDGQGVGDFFMKQWKIHYPNSPIPPQVQAAFEAANKDNARRGMKRFGFGRSIEDTSVKRNERASIGNTLVGALATVFLGGGAAQAHEMPPTPSAVNGDHGGLFALTRSGETLPGTNPYINAFPNTTIPGLDQMTLKQVYDLSISRNNGALGAVQIQAPTLKDVIERGWADVNWEDTFSKQTQEKIFWGLITANKQAKAFLYGEVPYSDDGINAVAETMYRTWAALPMSNGKSYYAKKGSVNKALVSVTDFREAIIRARESITGEHFHQR